jgi:hypothetical protein
MDSIEILKQHNRWRRDESGIESMVNATELGKAIDDVIKQAQIGNVALNVLRQIADGKRKTKEQRLANSCIKFLESFNNGKD